MNEEMKAAWLEISQMLGEPTKEELDVFLRTWQRAVQATREALAEQPAQQKPVACQYAQDIAMPEYRCIGRCQYDTSPPAQRPWVNATTWRGLTNDEIAAIYLANTDKPLKPDWLFARAIERKLKEKNT